MVCGPADQLRRDIGLASLQVQHPDDVLGDRIAALGRPLDGVAGASLVPSALQRAAVGVAQTPVLWSRLDRGLAGGHGLGCVYQVRVHARRRAERILRVVRQDVTRRRLGLGRSGGRRLGLGLGVGLGEGRPSGERRPAGGGQNEACYGSGGHARSRNAKGGEPESSPPQL